jgi:hypothetical protein
MLLNAKTGSESFAGILFTLKTARARTMMNVLGTILGLSLFSVALFAQGSYGRILGTVTDQTGAVLAGATVTVTDTERGLARTLSTDGAGEYNAPNLIPGTYTVRVEAKGFKALARQNVALEVGKEVEAPVVRQQGTIASYEVSGRGGLCSN